MNFGTLTSSGFTVWLTGMSGAGKSTLAQGLANRLRRLGKIVDVLDAPEVEQMLGVGKAMSKEERNAEVRKLTWVCRLVTRGGGMIIQSAVESPYREGREEARRQIGRFAEVFVECPTDVLIQRDKTGRYKRALAGELKTLVGITEPYEPPSHPEVVIDTSKHTVDESVEHILGQLVAQHLLDPSVAAMRGRPRLQPRATPAARPPSAPPPEKKGAPKSKVVKMPTRKSAKPAKALRSAPRKQPAARTARAERPRMAAGGKRKR